MIQAPVQLLTAARAPLRPAIPATAAAIAVIAAIAVTPATAMVATAATAARLTRAADLGSTMDSEDGGYTYASNVDNHRSLMADMCAISRHTQMLVSGLLQRVSTPTARTLRRVMALTALCKGLHLHLGKNHGYDAFYGADGSVDAMIMDALEGTGDFAGVSDTVRYQGIAKPTANLRNGRLHNSRT